MPLQTCPSQTCKDNRSSGQLVMRTRGSRFIKYQELRIQELPDQVPVGHIPRSVTVHCRYGMYCVVLSLCCSGERTRQCGPGDIVTIDGVFLTVTHTYHTSIIRMIYVLRFDMLDFAALLQDCSLILILKP